MSRRVGAQPHQPHDHDLPGRSPARPRSRPSGCATRSPSRSSCSACCSTSASWTSRCRSAGVNHLPVRHRVLDVAGDDGLARLRELLADADARADEPLPMDLPEDLELRKHSAGPEWTRGDLMANWRLKLELFERFGVLPGAGDRHLAEFFPNFLTEESGWGERWGVRSHHASPSVNVIRTSTSPRSTQMLAVRHRRRDAVGRDGRARDPLPAARPARSVPAQHPERRPGRRPPARRGRREHVHRRRRRRARPRRGVVAGGDGRSAAARVGVAGAHRRRRGQRRPRRRVRRDAARPARRPHRLRRRRRHDRRDARGHRRVAAAVPRA